MIYIIELEIGQYGDHRATGYERIQFRIHATHQAYQKMMEECRMFGISFYVYSILDHLGCVVAEIPAHHLSLLSGVSCVKSVRESKLHQQQRKCDN